MSAFQSLMEIGTSQPFSALYLRLATCLFNTPYN